MGNPLNNFNYKVTFTGKKMIHRTAFSQVTGLRATIDYTTYQEGGNNGSPAIIPRTVSYEPITLSYGETDDLELATAFSTQYDSDRGFMLDNYYTVEIAQYDRDGKTLIKKTTLTRVYIVAYNEGDFDAISGTIKINSIVLAFEGVDLT